VVPYRMKIDSMLQMRSRDALPCLSESLPMSSTTFFSTHTTTTTNQSFPFSIRLNVTRPVGMTWIASMALLPDKRTGRSESRTRHLTPSS
jgi:hypothetical protein